MQKRQVLFYEYVENAVEVRAPHREPHLALVAEWKQDGRMLDGGALGDPPTGALIVFTEEADVKEFVDADPYVQNGVATSWRVETWNVV